MKILITGGAGFIGSNLIDNLLQESHNVVCIDDLSLGTKENIKEALENPNFKFIEMDILNQEELDKVFLLLYTEIKKESEIIENVKFEYLNKLNYYDYNEEVLIALNEFLEVLSNHYKSVFNQAENEKERLIYDRIN